MDREKLYARLPIFLQNLAVHLEGRRIQRSRYAERFHRLLAEYEGRDALSAAEFERFRDERIAAFVRHAYATVPYYRERADVDPSSIDGLEALSRLPILDRATVQANSERLWSESFGEDQVMISHTSGSTGTGLRFPVSHEAHSEQWALWWRFRRWHGIRLDTPCLYFGGRSVVPTTQRRPPFWRINRPGHQIFFSGYHLSRANAPAYLAEMKRYPGAWMHGYPSLLALIASFAVELGERLDVRWISIGSESLLDWQIEIIEQAFGRRPIQHYGMSEGVANISEHPDGLLRIDEDYAAVEFEPIDGESYRILGTNLSNPAFPLLRYDTGDICRLPESARDAAGRRIVARVDGRREDYVITKSGAHLGRLDHIFKDLTRVREAQIHQAEPGAMTLRVVRAAGYSEADDRQLREETRKRVGDDVDFEIDYVEQVERTRRGKVRFVVSEVEAGRIERRS